MSKIIIIYIAILRMAYLTKNGTRKNNSKSEKSSQTRFKNME